MVRNSNPADHGPCWDPVSAELNSLNIYHTPALPCTEHQSALWETIVKGTVRLHQLPRQVGKAEENKCHDAG